MGLRILPMEEKHWEQVKLIFEQGIATQNATFEKAAPDWDGWDKAHIAVCRFVAVDGDEVCGWAALSPVSGRCVYSGVAEESIYVADRFKGSGIGTALLNHLVICSEDEGFWTLQAGIFPENEGSMRLHFKCGFRLVGIREKIGRMPDGKWRDVALMERRSKLIF